MVGPFCDYCESFNMSRASRLIVNPHIPMIKDNWFCIVFLGLSCHWRISDINISYFPFNITLFSECNLTASRLPAGIKRSSLCTFCKHSTDSIEHIIFMFYHWRFLDVAVIKRNRIWHHNLSIECIVLGDLENSVIFVFTLFSKKVIYNIMKNDKNTKNKFWLKWEKYLFQKDLKQRSKWNTLLNYLKHT